MVAVVDAVSSSLSEELQVELAELLSVSEEGVGDDILLTGLLKL